MQSRIGLFNILEELEDPRENKHSSRHLLVDILVLTILAVICGADNWVAIEKFGESKMDWLKTFLRLPHGIPSHDTIGNLFARLEPKLLQDCFLRWINEVFHFSGGEIIAIDGKTLRRSHNRKKGQGAIHMVSAWASRNQLVLGQRQVDDKSNEITAIPELLKMLDIEGCTITIDAMGCQKKIAEQIYEQGGDYVLAVKENQGKLHEKIEHLFADGEAKSYEAMWYRQHSTIDGGHGRVETRNYTVLPMMYLPFFKLKWKGLQSIAMVESVREIGDERTTERRYFISSLAADAKIISEAIRQHWTIENQLHWSLDMSFNEDNCRVRKGNAAGNLSIIRHIALNLLKHESSAKVGIKIKRRKAGWSQQYLAKVLAIAQL